MTVFKVGDLLRWKGSPDTSPFHYGSQAVRTALVMYLGQKDVPSGRDDFGSGRYNMETIYCVFHPILGVRDFTAIPYSRWDLVSRI